TPLLFTIWQRPRRRGGTDPDRAAQCAGSIETANASLTAAVIVSPILNWDSIAIRSGLVTSIVYTPPPDGLTTSKLLAAWSMPTTRPCTLITRAATPPGPSARCSIVCVISLLDFGASLPPFGPDTSNATDR